MSARWNAQSIASLCVEEIRQLRQNALRLGAAEVAGLCDAALAAQSAHASPAPSPSRGPKSRLIPRRAAFAMHGVHLSAGMSSWGGVRQPDGAVVIAVWADDVRSEAGGCSYLLWAPNRAGSRPWSDMPGGRERLEHCKLAMEKGGAEGFLVHGVRLVGMLPEQRARSVSGVDPAVVLRFRVVQRNEEYWAVWGGAAAARAPS
ncbi:MAG TPA: hypothetical protein VJQ51_14965, partial [Burkholderiales bacterium]|nr:hypothetical protein [Burkholderiales bacterium]